MEKHIILVMMTMILLSLGVLRAQIKKDQTIPLMKVDTSIVIKENQSIPIIPFRDYVLTTKSLFDTFVEAINYWNSDGLFKERYLVGKTEKCIDDTNRYCYAKIDLFDIFLSIRRVHSDNLDRDLYIVNSSIPLKPVCTEIDSYFQLTDLSDYDRADYVVSFYLFWMRVYEYGLENAIEITEKEDKFYEYIDKIYKSKID